MTVIAAVNPELCDSPCSVADCLEPADVMGSATVVVDPGVGLPPAGEPVTFGLPLCTGHAQRLRRGCTLTGFSSGL